MRRNRDSQDVKPSGKNPLGSAVTPAHHPGDSVEPVPPGAPANRNSSHGNSQGARKENAVALMVRGVSIIEVAATVKVHRATVHRWLSDPDFQRELSLRRDEFLEKTFDLQAYASTLATMKLIELLDSSDERVALRAGQALVAAERTYVLMDQERRVRRLEDNLPFLLPGAY